ncbi:MAG TPA: prenyltransferase [Turneriella sp.]|nr:prenyltransferase [Turneriella sp.]
MLGTALQRFFFYTEVLSLDIAIGVLGSGAFAKTVLHAPMKGTWWFLLCAAVWVVYTADHLMDARKVGKVAVNVRHKFHVEHFRIIFTTMCIVSLLCAILAWVYLREIIFMGGIVVGIFALFHLILAYWGKVRFGKEISVAVIYAMGVWFAPFLNHRGAIDTLPILFFSFFLLAALLNLFMNSVIEHALDHKENLIFGVRPRFVQNIRKGVIAISFLSVLFLCALAIYFFFQTSPIDAACAFYVLLLCATPGAILYFDRFFLVRQRYRIAAEWLFAFGLLLLFFNA